MKKIALFIAALALLTACTSTDMKEEDKTMNMVNSLQTQIESAEMMLAETNQVISEEKLKNEALLDELITLQKTDEMIKEDVDGLRAELNALKETIMEK